MKRSSNLIYPDSGQRIISDKQIVRFLKKERQIEAVRMLRKSLSDEIRDLREKFNSNSKYFGYKRVTSEETKPDCLYIYLQNERFVVDIRLPRDETEKRLRTGRPGRFQFEVRPRNNFQYQSGWLTGWLIPYEDLNNGERKEFVLRIMLKAFKER